MLFCNKGVGLTSDTQHGRLRQRGVRSLGIQSNLKGKVYSRGKDEKPDNTEPMVVLGMNGKNPLCTPRPQTPSVVALLSQYGRYTIFWQRRRPRPSVRPSSTFAPTFTNAATEAESMQLVTEECFELPIPSPAHCPSCTLVSRGGGPELCMLIFLRFSHFAHLRPSVEQIQTPKGLVF